MPKMELLFMLHIDLVARVQVVDCSSPILLVVYAPNPLYPGASMLRFRSP